MESEIPRCFISYSWDNEQHRAWVRMLAIRLIECGIDAILDQFDCKPGMDLAKFMGRSVKESDYVVLVCTPTFGKKADAGKGGVGYETSIVTGEIFVDEARETKFVPLLREGETKESLPSYLKSRLFVDFRNDGLFEAKLEELLRHFYSKPLYAKPPLGRKPDWSSFKGSSPKPKPTISKPARKPSAPEQEERTPPQQKITNTIGMDFVLIPAGSFKMGGDDNDIEQPIHKVTISRQFYLQNTQVTQGHWKAVMGHNPSEFIKCGDKCPVESVSWDDVQEFIKKLNKKEGGDLYRLPTEAEWEYACRAETTTEFSFGNDKSKLGDYAWFDDNSWDKTHPVATKKPNAWGLYDMHGNVWEWVEDDWHDNYDGAPDDGRAWIDDPRGPHRVLRGGSWYFDPSYCRSAARFGVALGDRDNNLALGFRLARSVALGP